MHQSDCDSVQLVENWLNSFHSSTSEHPTPLPSINLAEASQLALLNNALDDVLLQSTSLADYTIRSPMFSDSGISSDKENDASVLGNGFPSSYVIPASEEKTKFNFVPPSCTSHYITRDDDAPSLKERRRQQVCNIPTQDVIYPEPIPKHQSSDVKDLCQKPIKESIDYGERRFLQFLTQAWSDVAVESAAHGQHDESVISGAASKHIDNLVSISDEILNQAIGEGITDNKAHVEEDSCACAYVHKRKKRQGPIQDKRPRRAYFVKQMRSASDTYVYSFPMSTSHDLCSSTIITQNGGSVVLSDIPAGLFFDEGCITRSSVNASLSVCLDDDSPPIQFNQILMSIVMRCGPSGESFKTPVILEVPHSANLDRDEMKRIQVWCKSRNPDGDPEADPEWNKVYDASSDYQGGVHIAVHLQYIQIHTHHFCDWGILYDGPVDMVVLMLLNMKSLNTLDEVYVKVLVMLKEYVKEACAEEKKADWHVCSVSTTGVMFKVKNNEKPLHIRIFDVAPPSKWHNTELTDVIPYEYLQKGRAKIEFSFRKKRKSVLRIKGCFNIHQDENEYRVPNSYFDSGIIGVGQDRPPTPGYPNPPSNGSLGYMSASPGMSSNVGSVLSMQPPSVDSAPPASVQSQGKDQSDAGDDKVHGSPEPSTSQDKDKNQVPESPTPSKQAVCQEIVSSAGSTPEQESAPTIRHQTIYNIGTQYNVVGGQTVVDGDQLNNVGGNGQLQPQADAAIDSEIEFVKPDEKGYYNKHRIKDCWPSREQMMNKKTYYRMTSKNKGRALVVNNSDFRDKVPWREGSEIDKFNISHFLRQLGYVVEERDDSTASGITLAIKNFSSTCNQDGDCCSSVVVLMSYGNSKIIYGSDMKHVKLSKLLKSIHGLQGLKNKPKLVFYLADQLRMFDICQGGSIPLKRTPSANTKTASTSKFFKEDQESMSSILGEGEAEDVFIGYMSTNGHMPLRKEQPGSAFIQALCEVGFANAHKDTLEEMCNKVTQHISNMRAGWTGADGDVVQLTLPEWVTQCMTKKLCFLPGFDLMDMLSSAVE